MNPPGPTAPPQAGQGKTQAGRAGASGEAEEKSVALQHHHAHLLIHAPEESGGVDPALDKLHYQILKLAAETGLPAEDVARAPVPFAPFCVNVQEHFTVLLWFLPALMAMLAAKHALSRQGKRILMEMLVWNAVGLAVLGFIQQGTGAEFPYWRPAPSKPPGTRFFSSPAHGG